MKKLFNNRFQITKQDTIPPAFAVKGKVVPVHAMKVQAGGEARLHSFLIKEHQMEVVNFMPWPL